jgi:hypothetical protein
MIRKLDPRSEKRSPQSPAERGRGVREDRYEHKNNADTLVSRRTCRGHRGCLPPLSSPAHPLRPRLRKGWRQEALGPAHISEDNGVLDRSQVGRAIRRANARDRARMAAGDGRVRASVLSRIQ